MPRRPAESWRSPMLKQLLSQLLFAPAPRRAEQVIRCERLHDQAEAETPYPIELVIYRITGYRSETHEDSLIPGLDLKHDLRLMIDSLSRSAPMPPHDAEVLHPPQALAKSLNVSIKTLTRWRESGLRWRWVLLADQRKPVLVYPQASLKIFRQCHEQRLKQAMAFERIADEDRQRLIERARRLAQARSVSLHQVAAHLARRTGRAVETLRLILQKQDRDHPQQAIFIDRTGPLTLPQQQMIAHDHQQGVSVNELCQRFAKTRSTIRRAIAHQRAARILDMALNYHTLTTFDRDDADQVYLPPLAITSANTEPAPMTADLPEPIQELYGQPMLSPAAAQSLIVRMNYLLFKADRQRRELDRFEPRIRQMDQIEHGISQSQAIRRQLVQAHLPLVLMAARRQLQHVPNTPLNQATLQHLMALLETGNEVLYQAIEQFDPSTGSERPFRTYLNWLLMRRFASVNLTETSAGESKAIRRQEPANVKKKLIDLAGESGIDLRLEPLPLDDTQAIKPPHAS